MTVYQLTPHTEKTTYLYINATFYKQVSHTHDSKRLSTILNKIAVGDYAIAMTDYQYT